MQADFAAYRKKIAEYAKGMRELYLDKVKGLITESDFAELSKEFAGERERLEHMIANEESQIAAIDEKIALGDNRMTLIEEYTDLKHLSREMVDVLIDYILIGKRIEGTRDVPIEIHWRF